MPELTKRAVEGYGIRVELRPGWHARVFRRTDVAAPVLEAANFSLPRSATELGGLVEQASSIPLGPGDVYIALIDVTTPVRRDLEWAEAALPLAVEEVHFEPHGGRTVARRYLVVERDRGFILDVALGAAVTTKDLLADANAILASVTIEQWRPEVCPPDWPGPWTACPEAAWVGRVARAAGYRVVGETGSALVVGGRGHSFYLWATELDGPIGSLAKREGWRLLARVAGAPLYGDEDLWRWWPAQGSIFWMQAGPRGDSTLPAVHQMDDLIRVSRDLARPS